VPGYGPPERPAAKRGNMTEAQDRRAPELNRVPVRTLVEVCGRDIGGPPAFEAEAVDVSGRGMHVRTAYLPPIGAPLVCRFEEQGREIVVEGEVAWRTEEARGGEFGMRFTALDSGSVDALRELCGYGEADQTSPDDAPAEPAPQKRVESGSRVRLHIDGLGAPMKASVRDGGSRKLSVASNLEFLKVGRSVEIEEAGGGIRRAARIDSVNVALDPSTQVPQLVVSLRYDDVEESTPEPSVIDSLFTAGGSASPAPVVLREQARASSDDDDEPAPVEVAPSEIGDEEEDELDEQAQAMKPRIAVVAASAGAAMKAGGAQVAKLSAVAASGFGRLLKGAGHKVAELRGRQAGAAERRRRTTAPPPSSAVMSAGAGRLRPQSRAAQAVAEEEAKPGLLAKPRAKKVAVLAALAVLATTALVIAMKKPAEPPGASGDAPVASVKVAAGEPIEVDEQGNPIEAAKESKGKKLTDTGGDDKGITADVPLFGPTPMATMEPAPLGPPPEATGEATEEDQGEKEQDVADELWPDEPESGRKAKKVDPKDVPPWGRGKLDTPIVHRLRLDGPGGAIQGAITAMGFTVVIPERKVMESGKAIEQRDSRIARVKTKNGASGAEITFQFKSGVPGYRVRLRKDSVEFLISADAAKSSTKSAKSTPKTGKTKPGAKATPKKTEPAPKSKSSKRAEGKSSVKRKPEQKKKRG
jgi:hypothetical protein